MDGTSPPSNRNGYTRGSTTTAHRGGSRRSNGPSSARQNTRARSDADLVRLRVELAVPLPELEDRAVGIGERGRREERLVLPDRPILLDLLVDLLHERVGDGRCQL